MSYRTYRGSGYEHECPTKLTEALCRVIPGEKHPGYSSVRTLQNTTLEIQFVFMWAVQIDLISEWEIEFDFMPV